MDKKDLQLPILRLMCLFAAFILIIDISDLFMHQELKTMILDSIHVLQVVTVLVFLKKHKISLGDICIKKEKLSFKLVLISIVISLLLMFIDSLITNLISLPEPSVEQSSFASAVFMLIFAGFVAPVFEEIEFRALLFRSLNIRHSCIYALFMSSTMFFVIHTGYLNWGALGLGIISALMLLWTDNLAYSIIIHFSHNFILVALAFLSFFIPGNNDETINGQELVDANAVKADVFETFETIISLSFFVILLIILMIIVYKIARKNSIADPHNSNIKSVNSDPREYLCYIFYFSICIGSTIMQIVLNIN